jgi:hypothetical protein
MPSQLSFLLLVARARQSGQRRDAPLLLLQEPLVRAGTEKVIMAQPTCLGRSSGLERVPPP